MNYGDEVVRLRNEVANLKDQLGEKPDWQNEDLLGERPIGSKELEDLHGEQASLMQRLAAEDPRDRMLRDGARHREAQARAQQRRRREAARQTGDTNWRSELRSWIEEHQRNASNFSKGKGSSEQRRT